MSRFVRLLALCIVLGGGSAQAEKLTIAVSTPAVQIDSNFTGTGVTVFGVIQQDTTSVVPAGGTYGVAILIVGPPESVVVRRKDRVLGIWANAGAETLLRPPGFYALSTSGALAGLAGATTLQRLQIGLGNLGFVYADRASDDPAGTEFRNAFVRIKERAGLYHEDAGVTFIGDLVFRATVHLPANIPVGRYTVLAYIFAGGDLIAHAQESIDVSTTGLEATMTDFARNQALLYGVICAALAVFIGWLGGVIFRRD